MWSLTFILILAVVVLGMLLYQRVRRERVSAKLLFKLNDIERKYIGLAFKQGCIDAGQRHTEDHVFIDNLIEQGWLYELTDGSLGADSKSEYLELLLTADSLDRTA